jgi:hypothetical protein
VCETANTFIIIKFNKLLDRIVKKTQKKLSIKNHKKPGFKKGDSKTKRRWLG